MNNTAKEFRLPLWYVISNLFRNWKFRSLIVDVTLVSNIRAESGVSAGKERAKEGRSAIAGVEGNE